MTRIKKTLELYFGLIIISLIVISPIAYIASITGEIEIIEGVVTRIGGDTSVEAGALGTIIYVKVNTNMYIPGIKSPRNMVKVGDTVSINEMTTNLFGYRKYTFRTVKNSK